MTKNQIAYQNLLETGRSNRAREFETNRNNVATETETNRANVARERETNRANQAQERLTAERNAEQARGNRAQEDLKRREQDMSAEQKTLDRWTQATIAEKNRVSNERIQSANRDQEASIAAMKQDLADFQAYETAKNLEAQQERAKEQSDRDERKLQAQIIQQMYEMDRGDRNDAVNVVNMFANLLRIGKGGTRNVQTTKQR